jgi:drug/metabolite transporter (DMT)-like permease
MNDHAPERRQRLTGIAFMCAALALFAVLDAMAKYLNAYMDTLEVVWARYISALVFALLIANPVKRPQLMVTRRPLLQVARSGLLLSSTLFNFSAFRYLQLDQAMSIVFSTPFLVAALAGPILGEWIGWRRWIAICVGFTGVLVVTQPTNPSMHYAVLLSFGAALSLAFYAIMTRMLARTDSNETTLFYSNMVGAAVMSLIVPFVWSTPSDPVVIFLMVVCGAFGTFGHYFLIIAHRYTPASILAPFIYTQLIWATTLGYLVFSDIPGPATLLGAGIVIVSGLYLIHRERVSSTR